MASLETLRFVLLGDDRVSNMFTRLGRTIDNTTRAVDKNTLSLEGSKHQLDEITRKAEELSKLHPELKVQIETEAAKLKLALLRQDIRSSLNPDPSVINGPTGLRAVLQRIIGTSGAGASGAGASGILGIVSTLPSIGGVGVPAMGALAIAAVALGVALTPVFAALIPITIGFGTLAAVALPEVKKLFEGVTAKGKDLHKVLKDMSPAERDLVMQGRGLKDQFTQLGIAVKPEILKAFADGLKIIKTLMPAIKPLVKAAGKALDEFLNHLLNWLKSPQGQSFIHWLRTVGPQDIKNFGRVLWDVAHTVGDALHGIYVAGSWIDRFVTRWHEDWIIVQNVFKIIGNDLVIFALKTVRAILEPFTHLPVIGILFQKARDAAGRELKGLVADNKAAVGLIHDAWAALHAPAVPLNFDLNLPTGVHITSHGGEGRKHGAAGGLVAGGTPGTDSVPSLLMPGEVVVPTHMVNAGAVDHLRGKLPGFAAGGLVGFSDHFRPPVRTFDERLQAKGMAALTAIGKFVQNNFTVSGLSFAGGSGPGGPVEALMKVMAAARGWSGYLWSALNAVEMREAGYSLTAQNPTSGAYGLAQFINGPSEYFQWGGSPFTAGGQITGMLNYIASRYGNPAAAWGHELAFGWYDRGGFLPPGLSLAYNGTGRPEPVGGGITVNQYISGPVTNAQLAEIGRASVDAIQAYEKRSGKGWRS